MKTLRKKENGITLIALVITIIILLILVGVTITQLTGSGLIEKAKLAKQKSEDAEEQENTMLKEYENTINSKQTSNMQIITNY